MLPLKYTVAPKPRTDLHTIQATLVRWRQRQKLPEVSNSSFTNSQHVVIRLVYV